LQVQRGHTVLVHAAAGGVGSLLCQWANALGATVIGTVSTEEKVGQATQDGCQHVIVYTKEDFVTRVAEITSGGGVHVVYDAVGKDTFQVQIRPSCCFSLLPFLMEPCYGISNQQ
jgi:NADPH:quinone reductase